MVRLNNSCFKLGFLETPKIKAAKILPIPIAAPPKAIVANPAPINLAAINMRKGRDK